MRNYCENCFKELKNPTPNKFGEIYCSKKCMEQCYLNKHNECLINNLFN